MEQSSKTKHKHNVIVKLEAKHPPLAKSDMDWKHSSIPRKTKQKKS